MINSIKRTAFLGFYGALSAPFAPIASPLRLFSHIRHQKPKEELARGRFKALQSALAEEGLDGASLSKEIRKIRSLLQAPAKGNIHGQMQKVRQRVHKALGKSYEGEDARFLRAAAHAFVAKANGMDVYQRWGEKFLSEEPASLAKLVETLDAALKKEPFKKNNFFGKFAWMVSHPQKTAHSIFDHLGWTDPLKYNSYQHGNANVRIGAFTINGNRVHMLLGPTPTCDRLFRAHLEYLKEKKKGMHSQHTLESPWQKAENARREEQAQIAEDHEGQVVYTFGHVEDKKGDPHLEEEGIVLPATFTGRQKKGLETLLGVMFPKGQLSEKARRLGMQSLIAIQGLINLPKGEHFMGQACKQDIDRGVLVNVLTILFMDQLEGKKLTDERIAQILGIVLLRPGLVDDRAILGKRYEALKEVLEYLSKKPEALEQMKRHMLGFPRYWLSFSGIKGLGA
jgi:hypothetical protein